MLWAGVLTMGPSDRSTFCHRLTLTADHEPAAVRAWLSDVWPWDTVFIHGNRRRAVYTLALTLLGPRRRDEIPPRGVSYVARVSIPRALERGEAARAAWSEIGGRTRNLILDPRTHVRRRPGAARRRIAEALQRAWLPERVRGPDGMRQLPARGPEPRSRPAGRSS